MSASRYEHTKHNEIRAKRTGLVSICSCSVYFWCSKSAYSDSRSESNEDDALECSADELRYLPGTAQQRLPSSSPKHPPLGSVSFCWSLRPPSCPKADICWLPSGRSLSLFDLHHRATTMSKLAFHRRETVFTSDHNVRSRTAPGSSTNHSDGFMPSADKLKRD